MSIAVTGAYGQLGGELCRQLGPAAIPLDIDTLDLTDGPATVERMLGDQARGGHQLRGLYRGRQGRERAGEVPGRQCRGRRASGSRVRPSSIARWCRSAPTTCSGPCRRRRGRGAKTTPASRRAFMRERNSKASRPPPQLPKHLIVRTCGLYARPSDPRAANFVKTMLRLGAARPELRIVDDQHCTPTFVPHLARAILFLLGVKDDPNVEGDSPIFADTKIGTVPGPAPWGTYHVTNTGEATWCEFAAEIFRQAGMQVDDPADHHGRIRRAGGPAVVQRARHGGLSSARRPGDARLESGAGGVLRGVEEIEN